MFTRFDLKIEIAAFWSLFSVEDGRKIKLVTAAEGHTKTGLGKVY